MPTVLVYSDDAAVRERVRMSVGSTPSSDLGALTWLDAADPPAVTEHSRDVDLIILDGEAQPAGGLGISRQLKAELADCPPVVVLVARKDDAWLGRWSNADVVLTQPVDPAAITEAVVRLLTERLARPPAPVGRSRLGLLLRRR